MCVRPQEQALGGNARDVARTVAQHGQCLLGERGDDQLARMALGNGPLGFGSSTSNRKWSSQPCSPACAVFTPPGPMISDNP